jgi:hypothetical protein
MLTTRPPKPLVGVCSWFYEVTLAEDVWGFYIVSAHADKVSVTQWRLAHVVVRGMARTTT